MSVVLPARVKLSLAALASVGALSIALTFPSDRLIAEMFESEGKFDDAIHYSRIWNLNHPADFDSRWHTADLLLMTVRPEDAIATLEEMRGEWPREPRILERLVELEESLLRVEQALPRLEALVELTPTSTQALQKLADYYRWFGKTDEMIGTLKRLVRLGDFPDERYELTEVLLANRRYEELIAFCREDVTRDPKSPEPRQALYEGYLRSGRVDEALEQLRALIDLEPAKIDHLRELADQLVLRDRFPDAIALYDDRLAKNPSDKTLLADIGELYTLHAETLAKQGRRDEAVAEFRKRIAQEPSNIKLRIELSYLYGKDELKALIAELKDLARSGATSRELWATLGEYLGYDERMAEAVDAWQKAHTLAPNDLAVRRSLAQHLMWGDKDDQAIPHYRAIVERGGEASDRAVLIDLLLAADLPKEALPLAKTNVAAQPDVDRYRRQLADAAMLANDCATAFTELKWLTARHSMDAALWGQLGLCARDLGEMEVAMKALRAAQQLRRRGLKRSGEAGL